MDNIVYLDNIRGFKNTIADVRDVTFLVGNNSTGKSTFLSILHILENFTLYGDINFDTDEYGLGGFNDLVTTSSRDKSFFTIGKFHSKDRYGRGDFLISIASDDGLPVIKHFSFLLNNTFVTTRIEKDQLFWKIIELPPTRERINHDKIIKLAKIHKNKSIKTFTLFESKDKRVKIGSDRLLWFGVQEICSTHKLQPHSIWFGSNMFNRWIAPIRAKPKRIYEATKQKQTIDGNHIPYVIKNTLASDKAEFFRNILDDFGKDSMLFEDIKTNKYGTDIGNPFSLTAKVGSHYYSVANVGYGVSQVLPIVVESITQYSGTAIYIQQPEVHLHPQAQAAIGTLICKLMQADKKAFIIETHSDFLIDRFRLEYSKTKSNSKGDASVLFFQRTQNGNTITEIKIEKNGAYSSNQPKEFREFFIHEQLKLMDI